MYIWYTGFMDVPISQFRRNLFALIDKALDGETVCITHKGRKLKIVPDGGTPDKLSRITPMDIIPSNVDVEDDSWKQEMMREWERGWDRQLEAASGSARPIRAANRQNKRQTQLKA